MLVAPDKFKGTLSAQEAALAIARGLAAGGCTQISVLPLADGGEGTMEAIVHARRGRILSSPATDALGRRVDAAFGLLEGGKEAVVEQAQASGLWRLAEGERDAVGATSRGTGELIAAAGGLLLIISLFLPWFGVDVKVGGGVQEHICGNDTSCTAWQTFNILDFLLVAAGAAPLILIWIIVRGHELTSRVATDGGPEVVERLPRPVVYRDQRALHHFVV